MSIRVVFMGSPDFALPVLRSLAKQYELAGVVTQPDRVSGRGRALAAPPVKSLALDLNIPVLQPEKVRAPEAMAQLHLWKPELIVVAAFGQILKKDLLELPRFGCLNVHASLLPRWRGAAPIQAAILEGDQETGVTIMKMDAGLDTGPLLSRKSIRLTPNDTAGSVFESLSLLGADLLIETLPDYLSGKLPLQPQPQEGVTLAPQLKKEDGRLDFTRPAEELERRVRAFDPWPGTWFEWKGTTLKVTRAAVSSAGEGQVGERVSIEGKPAVVTGRSALILEELQPPGRKIMSGKAFLAGMRDWTSS